MNYFKQPCNYFSKPWRVMSFNSVLSALMLLFYEPFDYHFNGWGSLLELFVFVFIVVFFSFLFFYLLPQKGNIYHRFGVWTIGKNLVYLSLFLLCVGFGIFIFDFHVITHCTFKNYCTPSFYKLLLTDVFGVFSIGVIPLSFSYLLEKTVLLRMTIDEQEENLEFYVKKNALTDNPERMADKETIKIECDNKNTIDICPSCIELIEAAGNYVCIYSFDGQLEKTMVRATLTKLEEQLLPYPFLVRCHRTFIVNISSITKFYRRKEGYRLQFQHYNNEIPVSRTYLSKMRDLLK